MRTVVLTAPGHLELVDRPEPPDPGPGEVLVAVRRIGLCGTDFHAYGGDQNFISYPCVLGHELAVEVLALGPGVAGLQEHDLCAVLPYVSCGDCPACRQGRGNCCERLDVLGVTRPGGMRERMVLPTGQLFPAPGLTADQLVLVETLGIGWHAVARARPRPEDRVLVVGAGPIGLAVALAARHRGGRVTVADVSPERVAFAAAAGLDGLVVDDDFDAALADGGGGPLPSLVFDASGSRASMEAAFGRVGAGGTLVMVGHTTAWLTFHNPGFHARELDVRASRNATPQDWAEVISAVGAGTLDAVGWINHRSPLDAVPEELPRLAAGRGPVMKAVIDLDADLDPDGALP